MFHKFFCGVWGYNALRINVKVECTENKTRAWIVCEKELSHVVERVEKVGRGVGFSVE